MLCQVHSASSPFYSPLLRSNKTSSQRESRADPFQMNVSLCWGGWSPFSGASPPPDAPVCVGFRLRTGPGMTPYDVPVFRSDKHTAHIRYYFTHWSEQVEEETRLKRETFIWKGSVLYRLSQRWQFCCFWDGVRARMVRGISRMKYLTQSDLHWFVYS